MWKRYWELNQFAPYNVEIEWLTNGQDHHYLLLSKQTQEVTKACSFHNSVNTVLLISLHSKLSAYGVSSLPSMILKQKLPIPNGLNLQSVGIQMIEWMISGENWKLDLVFTAWSCRKILKMWEFYCKCCCSSLLGWGRVSSRNESGYVVGRFNWWMWKNVLN